jgi:predicted ATPase
LIPVWPRARVRRASWFLWVSRIEAVAIAREIAHPPSLGFALTFAAIVHYLRGEPKGAEGRATETISLSKEHGMAQSLGWGMFWQGWAMSAQGNRQGTMQMQKAIEAYRHIGSRISAPQFLGLLAEAVAREGNTGEAARLLDEAIGECEVSGENYCAPELYLLKGRILRDEQSLRRAVECAERCDAPLWRQKAMLALAALRSE